MAVTRLARTWILMAVMAVVCSAAAVSARGADSTIVGTWKGAMDTQVGATDVTLAIERDAPLSGKASLGTYEGKLEGKTDGDKVAFTVTLDHGTIKFEGNVTGDEMTLTVTGTQGDVMKLVVKKQK